MRPLARPAPVGSGRRAQRGHAHLGRAAHAERLAHLDDVGFSPRFEAREKARYVAIAAVGGDRGMGHAASPLITRRRNSAVVEQSQAGTTTGTWVSDLWKPQLRARAEHHQICLAHQLRDRQYVIDREQSAWARECQALFRRTIHRAHQRDRGGLWGAAYAAAVRKIDATCDHLLATPVPGVEASRLWVRFREQRGHLFVFLYDPAVPPNNNASEQALRPSVVHRKVSGALSLRMGADAHATVATVLDTARKRGDELLAVFQATLGLPVTSLPQPALPPAR
jgi:hypothetical protein